MRETPSLEPTSVKIVRDEREDDEEEVINISKTK